MNAINAVKEWLTGTYNSKVVVLIASVLKPFAVFCVVIIILISGLDIYFKVNTEEITPTTIQAKVIERSMHIACSHMSCTKKIHESTSFKIRTYPIIAELGKPWDLRLNAETFEHEGSFDIHLSEHLFDDYIALTVFIFHELAHVKYSDHRLYQETEPTTEVLIKQCKDHNHVKQLTAKFAQKIDLESLTNGRIHGGKTALYYSRLPGNRVQDCEGYTNQ